MAASDSFCYLTLTGREARFSGLDVRKNNVIDETAARQSFKYHVVNGIKDRTAVVPLEREAKERWCKTF